jgi:dihydroneopterin aldolase
MASRNKWTIKVQHLQTQLRVGIYPHEEVLQPIVVNITIHGLADTRPTSIEQCIDYESICRWAIDQWPESKHTPLLETRVNQLIEVVFNSDKRIQNVQVGLFKTEAIQQTESVGVEREMSRRQFDEYSLGQRASAAAKRPIKNVETP